MLMKQFNISTSRRLFTRMDRTVRNMDTPLHVVRMEGTGGDVRRKEAAVPKKRQPVVFSL